MIDVVGNVLGAALLAAEVLLLVFLVWVAATSRSSLAIFGSWVLVAEAAIIVAATVLAFAGLVVWWAALLIVVLSLPAFLVALARFGDMGFSRHRLLLKEQLSSDWDEGDAKGKQSAKRLRPLPASVDEARRVFLELQGVAVEAHLERQHEDPSEARLAFSIAFREAFWTELRSAGFAPKQLRRRPWYRGLRRASAENGDREGTG